MKETTMTIFDRPNFLRIVLGIDAASCAIMGLGLVADARAIAKITALSSTLMTVAGLVLLPVALFIAIVAAQRPIPAIGVWIVIAGNLAWGVASVALLLTGTIAPNVVGALLVVGQAVAVLIITDLEYMGLRHQRRQALG
ncbi:hypothetical protein SJ05684_b53800 (plasmid) [Sinorhizobium sojae CCBAU 05684]|uniref:Integral membrane protein n=2 Tax=Sinorhizobium sojae TaxID=716925 RepID=A0A249PKU0_9HYPH|nr:hypothetical protein SJ05684_b53800 [Sinorhizobium sojae CCBAU 05684]